MFPCNLPGFEDFLDMVDLGFYWDVKHEDKTPESILKSSRNKNENKDILQYHGQHWYSSDQNLHCIIYERHWHYITFRFSINIKFPCLKSTNWCSRSFKFDL